MTFSMFDTPVRPGEHGPWLEGRSGIRSRRPPVKLCRAAALPRRLAPAGSGDETAVRRAFVVANTRVTVLVDEPPARALPEDRFVEVASPRAGTWGWPGTPPVTLRAFRK
jgi:hypothetical protein